MKKLILMFIKFQCLRLVSKFDTRNRMMPNSEIEIAQKYFDFLINSPAQENQKQAQKLP